MLFIIHIISIKYYHATKKMQEQVREKGGGEGKEGSMNNVLLMSCEHFSDLHVYYIIKFYYIHNNNVAT